MGFAPPQLLAMQSTAGNQAVTRMIQREVRIGNGATKPDAAYYKTGAGKKVGSKRKVSSLMKDPVKRIFTDQTELENYANGTTDYIGDVKTGSKETFWYRLPANKLTVLGEAHHDKDGNVEDVIKGLNTKRFKYEPFNELVPTTALSVPTPGTQKQLDKANKNINVAGQVDRAAFNPDLENIVSRRWRARRSRGTSTSRCRTPTGRRPPGRSARTRASTPAVSGSRSTSRWRSTSRRTSPSTRSLPRSKGSRPSSRRDVT
jgi:hypothetical protein